MRVDAHQHVVVSVFTVHHRGGRLGDDSGRFERIAGGVDDDLDVVADQVAFDPRHLENDKLIFDPKNLMGAGQLAHSPRRTPKPPRTPPHSPFADMSKPLEPAEPPQDPLGTAPTPADRAPSSQAVRTARPSYRRSCAGSPRT